MAIEEILISEDWPEPLFLSYMQKAPKPNLGALTDFIYSEFETPTRRAAERISGLLVDNWDRIKGYVE